MAYFKKNEAPPEEEPYYPAFKREEEDQEDEQDDGFDELLPEEEEEELTPEEKQARRRDRLEMAAGMWNFGATVVGVALCLVLLALLISLITWLQQDISQTFTLWENRL